jgi:hypothetical protein
LFKLASKIQERRKVPETLELACGKLELQEKNLIFNVNVIASETLVFWGKRFVAQALFITPKMTVLTNVSRELDSPIWDVQYAVPDWRKVTLSHYTIQSVVSTQK